MEPYEQDYCELCGLDFGACGCGPDYCERCHGEGRIILNEIEWYYCGSDMAECPTCGGSGVR